MKIGIKEYLGDSIYAEFDGLQLTLTTENGFGPSNTIILEDWTYAAIVNFASTRENGEPYFKIPKAVKS